MTAEDRPTSGSQEPGNRKTWKVGGGDRAARKRFLAAAPPMASEARSRHAPAFWFTPGTLLAAVLAATVVSTILELGIGRLILGRIGALGGTSVPALFAYVASHLLSIGSAAAVVLGLVAAAFAKAPLRLRILGLSPGGLLLFGLAAAGFVLANLELFRGGWISALRYARVLEAGFFGVGTLLLWFSIRALWLHFTAARASRRPRAWAVAALFTALLAAALQAADATRYTGAYPRIHLQIAVLAVYLHVIAWLHVFAALEDRAPRRGGRTAVAALVVLAMGLGGAVWMRARPDVHGLRVLAEHSAHPLLRKTLGPLEDFVLDRIRPLEAFEATDVSDVAARLFVPRDVSSDLDRLLGEQRRDFNVLVIAADTLRYDAVGFSGGASQHVRKTPNIDRLAAGAFVFERAYTPYPTSNFAYSSMLTGAYPRRTPARRAVTEVEVPPADGTTLPEVLKKTGRSTWAVTAFNAIGVARPEFFGHTRTGFDIYNPVQTARGQTAADVVESSIELMRGRDRKKPFFLWMHMMEPHEPQEGHPDFPFGTGIRELYDADVAVMDRAMAPLVDLLLSPEFAADTVVVFLSDHGESFGEHNTRQHNNNLHDVETRIPFFLRIPGVEGRKVGFMANLVDLAPTVESLLAVEGPQRMGRDLCPPLFELVAPHDWVDFSYSERFPQFAPPKRRMERALVWNSKKLIRYAGDPSIEVYDLAADPGETTNIAARESAEHKRLLGLMDAIDRRIDGFSGDSPPTKQESAASLFDTSILLLFNGERGDDMAGLIGLAQVVLDRSGFLIEAFAAELGADRMAKLREGLLKLHRERTDDPDVQNVALLLLTNLPQPELLPFMRTLAGSGDLRSRTAAVLWLARSGHAEGKETLAAWVASLPFAGNADLDLLTAGILALAGLGDPTTAEPLSILLGLQTPESLVRVLRALRTTPIPDLMHILRERHETGSPAWVNGGVEEALAALAAPRDDAGSTMLLMRLSLSQSEAVQSRARAALEARIAAPRRADAARAAELLMLGDEAMRDRRYEAAASRYREARELLAPFLSDDLLALKVARAGVLAGRKDEGIAALDALVGDPETSGHVRAAARGLALALRAGAPVERGVRDYGFDLALAGPAALPTLRTRTFATRVRIVNKSAFPIAGGVAPFAPRFAWLFRDKTEGVWYESGALLHPVQTWLPPSGLGPGESVEITVLGVTPSRLGTYVPVLVLLTGPWIGEESVPLHALPEVVLSATGF